MNLETRLEKWMKYREEILENKNIRKSLVNSNPSFHKQYKKISTIFHNVDFFENDDFTSRHDYIDSKIRVKVDEIENYLLNINNIEKRSGRKIEEKNYNSNKYHKFIEIYFNDEYKKNIETKKIKITKIDLEK